MKQIQNGLVLIHHGIDGQRWGQRNGPPYPLSRQAKQEKNRQKKISKDYKKHIRKKSTMLYYELDNDSHLQDLKANAQQSKKIYSGYASLFYDRTDNEKYRIAGYRFLSNDPIFKEVFSRSLDSNIEYRKYGSQIIDSLTGKYMKQKTKDKILEKYLK